ncbi:MAG TPA: 50S ribosomal protein L35ae [Candidatus Paceibacterota bacterium]|nr:50S ribosomal protein L35ae [Candidatus Paceibacterota bacterium]
MTNKGKVIQFRQGRHTVTEKHFILDFGFKTRAEAEKSIGKEVTWTSPGVKKKVITGKISGAHGNKGLVRAIFEKGLPGQALTTEVEMK